MGARFGALCSAVFSVANSLAGAFSLPRRYTSIVPHDLVFKFKCMAFPSSFFGCRELSHSTKQRTTLFFVASGGRNVEPQIWTRGCRGTLDERSKRRLKRFVDLR